MRQENEIDRGHAGAGSAALKLSSSWLALQNVTDFTGEYVFEMRLGLEGHAGAVVYIWLMPIL
jgi:hypothetical protein